MNNIDKYNTNLNTMVGLIDNTKYLFEMTKCCGYGFILPIYKMNTLEELKEKLKTQVDEVTLLDLLGLTSEDLY